MSNIPFHPDLSSPVPWVNRQWLLAILWLVPVSQVASQEDGAVQYAQVAVVLGKYCAGCHNAEDHEGDFSVDSFKAILAGTPDGPVLVPGNPTESKLLQLLTGKQEPAMPPEDEPQPTAEDVALLRRWVEQGARGAVSEFNGKLDWLPPKLEAAGSQHHHVAAACAVGPNRYALGSLQQVLLKDAQTNQLLWTTPGLSGKVNALRTSSDGSVLVVGGGVAGLGGEVVLLKAADGTVLKRFVGHNDSVYCAALSPDGHLLASGSYDRSVLLWDVRTGEKLHQLTGHNGAIYDLDFDATGQLLATASADQTVKLWQVPTGLRLDTFGQPEGEQLCVRFSPDGRFVLAAGADRQIRKWEIFGRDKPAINPLRVARYAHESDILQIEFLPVLSEDPARYHLLSTARDRTVKAWHADRLAPLGVIAQLEDVPVGLCLGLNDTGMVRIFDLAGNHKSISLAHLEPSGRPSDSGLVHPGSVTADVANQATAFRETTGPQPSNNLRQNPPLTLPADRVGKLGKPVLGDEAQDLVSFFAKQGETWIIEVRATKDSPLDSRIDVLDHHFRPLVRTQLQAMRETYFTFRGKDSVTADDFRLHKWEDMELDEFLYANGEVNRLWLYPRGPDSGFKVYPGSGPRYAYFDTTPLAHALGEPAYIVRELAPGEQVLPNGLPVFPIYYENDDDAHRQLGKDSRLTFVVPADGQYWLRIRDARGFGGEQFEYRLSIREPCPDFSLAITDNKMSLPIGSGREWMVLATRLDGLQAPIEIELSGLPEGLLATNPVIIEAEQPAALGCIFATAHLQLMPALVADSETSQAKPHVTTQAPHAERRRNNEYEITLTARTLANGRELVRQLDERLIVAIEDKSEVKLRLVDANDSSHELEELSIRPGQTVSARVIVERNGNRNRIGFGKEDSGRNLPHGAFVDNIGLNGLLITEQQQDREFFITAAPKLHPGRRQFHLQADAAGKPTSRPIWLNVLPPQ